jgi:hypothetical protein
MCEGGGVLGCPSPTQPSPTPRPAVCVRAGRRHHAATRGQAFVRGPVHRLLRRRGRCCCCCSSSSRPLPITPSLSIPPSLPPLALVHEPRTDTARGPPRRGKGLASHLRHAVWEQSGPRHGGVLVLVPSLPIPWSCPGTLRVEGRSVPLFLPAVHGPDLEAYPPTVRVRGSRSGVLVPSLFLAGTGKPMPAHCCPPSGVGDADKREEGHPTAACVWGGRY